MIVKTIPSTPLRPSHSSQTRAAIGFQPEEIPAAGIGQNGIGSIASRRNAVFPDGPRIEDLFGFIPTPAALQVVVDIRGVGNLNAGAIAAVPKTAARKFLFDLTIQTPLSPCVPSIP